ncbi:hypothetical protein RB195_014567 [Necator americanus]|uniref:Uncharacterized protein n=1 Tax=Necator americanus TaxID=51031 RepID=A0ABR1E0N6_NECAM
MSWRDQSPREFDPHGGRNAFRTDDTLQTTSERVASFRAMRSFTESIECDLPPAPELPAQLDIDRISMRTSDTNETIVEVVSFFFSAYKHYLMRAVFNEKMDK